MLILAGRPIVQAELLSRGPVTLKTNVPNPLFLKLFTTFLLIRLTGSAQQSRTRVRVIFE